MKIINLKNNLDYLKEYIKLCSIEWGTPKNKKEMEKYIDNKIKKVLNEDKVISILGLVDRNELLGFISLFKYEDNKKTEITPWYATMYVKDKYRGNGYSKILNNEIVKEAKKLGYSKVYLKTNLENYYEKFGAVYLKDLNEKEKLYYINL